MEIDPLRLAPPTEDKRWKLVQSAMRRHGYEPNALIETLHTVQEAFGYLEKDSLRYVAASLRVPYSRVYGVVTFYHFFTLKPKPDGQKGERPGGNRKFVFFHDQRLHTINYTLTGAPCASCFWL